jgi:hypothetical protein
MRPHIQIDTGDVTAPSVMPLPARDIPSNSFRARREYVREWILSFLPYGSNEKMRFQSFFMLMTVQPFFPASS